MRIAFIGKFGNLYDEEYIARSFEMLGHEVLRLSDRSSLRSIIVQIVTFKPAFVLFCKFHHIEGPNVFKKEMKQRGIPTVCWLFDLYWGYAREHRIFSEPYFRADYVFTTDGGHDAEWKKAGVNHQCVRQGIYRDECVLRPADNPSGIVFVGGENPLFVERTRTMQKVAGRYGELFTWYGRRNTHEARGMALNDLYSHTKVVIGDSVYSPQYWSNRVVETLGRGGMLIHQDVPGLSTAYPHLVTYEKGNIYALFERIDYFLTHEDERLSTVKKNFEWVRDHGTMDKKCAELLALL